MAGLDDCLRSLRPGEGEVMVPKTLVTEELQGWTHTNLCLPRESSVIRYRKGRSHAHDMAIISWYTGTTTIQGSGR